ncbi:MAG TPA: pyridoxal-phosphate dependent enzyme, partial [Anaerolineales bacterium]|nr:pyridoxal-phosphate dependent enzyme [Anaerolineales bacterium]
MITGSTLTHLTCPECNKEVSADRLQRYCADCASPWLAVYELAALRTELDRDRVSHRPRGMWRWAELLPVHSTANQVSLGEGDTPLLQLDRLGACLGLEKLFLKDEGANPTGSFKARGMAAAISMAKELGVEKVIVPTAGNAGGAMAAYAARAGLQACVIMPQDTP